MYVCISITSYTYIDMQTISNTSIFERIEYLVFLGLKSYLRACITRAGGILATKPLDYYQCHRYLVPPGFHPVDGAENRACRGASVDDNLAEHYLVVQGIATAKECSSALIFRLVS